MRWIEKHIDAFFKLNGILLILITIFLLWGMYSLFALPRNTISTWTSYQWDMVDFLWKPTLIYAGIYIVLSILCFKKYFVVFPVILLYLSFFLNASLENITQILKYGFIYLVNNTGAIFYIAEFILSIIGTILWVRKLHNK